MLIFSFKIERSGESLHRLLEPTSDQHDSKRRDSFGKGVEEEETSLISGVHA